MMATGVRVEADVFNRFAAGVLSPVAEVFIAYFMVL
jgi:hypothetical protein